MFTKNRVVVLCFLAGFLAFGCFDLPAQTAQGRISGVVTDPAKAVIPGVAVKAINMDTGLETNALSNEVGRYVLPFLPPGRYKIAAVVQGCA